MAPTCAHPVHAQFRQAEPVRLLAPHEHPEPAHALGLRRRGQQLTDRRTHVDVEPENSNRFAWATCGQSRPRTYNAQAQRELSAAWARDIDTGARSPAAYSVGATAQALIGAQRATLIV